MSFKLTGLTVEGIVLFKEASLDLGQPQLAVVRGINRDSSVPNSNGAGKSLLFNCLSALLYDSPPTANRRKSSKDMFAGTGKIELAATIGDAPHRFTKYVKGKSLKLRIERNDEDLKIRTLSSAQSYLEECFPLSQELFYQLVYLRGTTANTLLGGTPVQRHTFFEKIFHLEDYDFVAQKLRGELKYLKERKVQKDTLEGTLEKPDDLGRLRLRAKRVKDTVRGLTTELTTLEKQLTQATKYEALAKRVPKHYRDPKAVKAKYKAADQDYRELLEREHQYRDNQREWNDYRQYRKRRKHYEQRAHKFSRTKLKALRDKLAGLQRKLHDEERIAKRLAQAEPVKQARQKIIAKAKVIQKRLAILRWQAKQVADGKCPVCGTKISLNERNRLEQEIDKDQVAFFGQWHKLQEQEPLEVGDWLFDSDPKGQEKRVAKLQKQVDKYDKRLRKLGKGHHYYEQLEELEVVAKPKHRIKPVDQSDLDKLRERASQYKHYYKLAVALHKTTKPKRSYSYYLSKVKAVQTELDQLRLKQQTLSQQLGQAEEQQRTYRKTKKKITKLKKQLVDLPLVTALVEAYGPKGLRGYDVDELVGLYVNNLNQYSSLVFSEPVDFSYVIGNRSVQLLATRGKRTYDICHLSGAESQAFNLLSLLALTPLVPEQYRSNVLIMDEIDSAMSPQNRKLLANELLPRLQQLIPTIFVVTPHSEREFYVPNSVNYIVERKRGRSKLERG